MEIPTLAELFQVAPIATIVLLIAYGGYWLGHKSSEAHIQSLKDWIDHLIKYK